MCFFFFSPTTYADEETLNALQWTGKLDATFVDNVRLDPTLHWQYFATRNGLLRYFPGHRWRLPADRPDTFDARQRPWFTQTLSSAKDLVVLIDVSVSRRYDDDDDDDLTDDCLCRTGAAASTDRPSRSSRSPSNVCWARSASSTSSTSSSSTPRPVT